ncbi:DNA polymerase III subunit delta [Candidatus Cardinium hertigii]|uniref:DNA polymerase III subunit delta n=1 Tax=Candidatus Cardinium hertigii TaxID=247481 RepID=A0A2Z3LIE3_9BACT|nr:DNA polymerase III subunit delta [Candidatus Cardinium hertigii]AWN81830.1 putative protein YqeN [Candidatus Cardinium hertigii]
MIQSAETVLQKLQQGSYAPIYFLQGEESYHIDAITKQVADTLLTPAERSFNLTIFYGKECSMAALLTQARRPPIGTAKQVVIVKEAQEMSDLKQANGQKLLLNYLRCPSAATVLLFAYKYKTIDGRSLLYKALANHTVVVTAQKLYAQQLPAFIQSIVKKMGCTITDKAIGMLQTCLGNDLTKIANELHKLGINLTEGSSITDRMVETYIDLYQPFNIFALQKAIMQKDYAKSCQIVGQSAANIQAHAALPVVALLYNCFSKLIVLHETKATELTMLAQQIEVPPYFVPDYLNALKNYTLPQTLQNITYIYQADLQLKGIEPAPSTQQILQLLVFKLLHEIH